MAAANTTRASLMRRALHSRVSIPSSLHRAVTPLVASGLRTIAAPRAILPTSSVVRNYASGRPHPPGGTHRMNLGGEPEKPALEEYGVDLTERAKDGKLDPVIGRDAEIH